MRKFILLLIVALLSFPCNGQIKKPQNKITPKSTTKTKKKARVSDKKKTTEYSNASISGLKNQRAKVQRKIKEQERLLRVNKADVKKRLENLLVINSEINKHKKSLYDIEQDILSLDGNIQMLQNQLTTLEEQLKERKARYIKSMQYMARNRGIEDKLMFVFSAKNFAQMYRRMRFVREYAAYQRAQGEMIKEKQAQIVEKNKELEKVRGNKNVLLYKGRQEQATLKDQQAEQQKVVNTLQKQQKTIQAIIDDQKKKDATLNAQIDRLIAQEVAKAKARAEAEARRKAAEAQAKKRQEELARKKAMAEAIAKENARKLAEAKAREEKMKAEARVAEKKSAEEKERAEIALREAEADRVAIERKAKADEKRHENEIAKAKKHATEIMSLDSEDRKLSGNFERNRGLLPMPITGSYRIVSHFGQYNVEGLNNVKLDNKGINILGSSGAMARSIFDGEVSAVFSFGGSMVVMVRHGKYISVYCNLKSVNVHRGQRVSTRQVLGAVGSDNILQFQLRREVVKLNPEIWLGR
ncbi:MAG: peptidoglycan DD-metalloendopeptidase family protein [Prevotella sp.]